MRYNNLAQLVERGVYFELIQGHTDLQNQCQR